ncbi:MULTISPECIES: mannose-1-phosphate guanylyltransferase/mannose-6-phosphate isomerase [Pseudomonas]|jgi:mannose-1-phosphate guanylyltransferase/mannose-6-phosphate isomerase|uniref:mannose-1-phosphate guanylyltransferase/mannose-6-phosphate isomerase n=1 Tax=Pseudomonas TaxID=286 RepID=UPI0002E72C0A|nr:mannose-1-phosphate guanylyltransferase/mannose-6-phosphate isomerase [Pseudomonas putida]ANI04881.1 mannose-1-phosphate guanylyltransferase/mannose-6-phosphate isomerase [Pseudomonas putida SJTE-1]ELS0925901.1 mannose-1-phosphate guanylyltransferase/mannose-6-phosphate isomerase [Pseudomonas putida]MDD2011421.1 mannose-1-phosphate guanylyltransferase/mannose-6-phosphate isomerase [Pseudomonas putida]TFW39000.1 mannose-1-phosphate guanylyltransferase/mannose-6-phosphate isomerase [Pseudomona
MELIPVILSGGVGSRLWPVSREAHPKPFMTLPDGQNLIQKTFLRAADLNGVVEILTVTNRELLFKTEDEYRTINKQNLSQGYILEPFGRNTAAAVAAAALQLLQSHGPQVHMLVLAADHLIQNEAAFSEAVSKAVQLAGEGWLVTFGIKPQYPETGFGYIEAAAGGVLEGGLRVERFVEKPDAKTAEAYVAAGNYFWNAGMFCFQVGTVIEQFRAYAPDVLEAVERTLEASRRSTSKGYSCLALDAECFASVPDISIDYALMERSSKVATIPCDIGWSDIGSWNAVSELTLPDEHGNRFDGEVMAYGASNNYVSTEDRLAALVGVQDLLVVDTPDALLIAHKDHAQDVKHIVKRLKNDGHTAHLLHQTVHRPWGTYTTLEDGERFKIKRIVVKPKASLSLQMHHHRSEHWIVVSGMAVVVNDDQELMLNTNESTFIRAGHKHRLQNPGVIDLVLIEVQSGDYLGEDDIVRFEDNYGRCDA